MLHKSGLIVLVAFIAVATAHICVWSPRQRGELSIAIPGDPACYRPYPYCGNTVAETPKTTLIGGSQFTIEYQQNLNHYWRADPGFMIADISFKYDNVTDKDFTIQFGPKVADYDAHDMLTQTNFTITGLVPNVDCAHCVLRVRYISNNPDEVNNHHGANPNAVFYQCSDIKIVRSS